MTLASMKLLQQTVQAKAFLGDSPGNGSTLSLRKANLDADTAHALESLQAIGALQCVEECHGVWSCKLTPFGLQHLRHTHVAAMPTGVFRPPDALARLEDEELNECSAWELLTLLGHQGWRLVKSPKKPKERKQLPPISASSLARDMASGQLLWYLPSTATAQQWHYMRALVGAPRFFDSGSLQVLHHCQPKKYYVKVLEGKSDGQLPVAIMDAMPAEDRPLLLDGEPEDWASGLLEPAGQVRGARDLSLTDGALYWSGAIAERDEEEDLVIL